MTTENAGAAKGVSAWNISEKSFQAAVPWVTVSAKAPAMPSGEEPDLANTVMVANVVKRSLAQHNLLFVQQKAPAAHTAKLRENPLVNVTDGIATVSVVSIVNIQADQAW